MPHLSALSLALNRPGAVGLTLEQAVAALFASGEQGAWYDPSDYSTMFETATGNNTPISTVEKAVGLIFDKRKGLTLGSELITNGTFDTNTTGWTPFDAGTSIASVGGQCVQTIVSGAASTSWASFSTVIGKWYKISFSIEALGAGTTKVQVYCGSAAGSGGIYSSGDLTTPQEVTAYFRSTGTTTYLNISGFGSVSSTITFDNISVKLVDGNHAYQTGSTARPVLRARYNLLTYSEQFDQGVWTKQTNVSITANNLTAPDSTSTADTLTWTSASNNTGVYIIASGLVSGATYTGSIYVYAASAGGTVGLTDPQDATTETIHTLVQGWQRITVTKAAVGTSLGVWLRKKADSPSTLGIWGADLRVGTSAGDYQRIEAAPTAGGGAVTYATTSTITGQPFRPYLLFDGIDDQMKTVGFGSTVMDMFTGYFIDGSKTTTNVFQFSVDLTRYGPTAESGSAASTNQNIGTVTFRSNGAAETFTDRNNAYTKTSNKLQVFGTQSINPSAWTETILFAYPSPPSLGLKGNVYGHIIRQSLSASERATVETYLAGKTGVTL